MIRFLIFQSKTNCDLGKRNPLNMWMDPSWSPEIELNCFCESLGTTQHHAPGTDVWTSTLRTLQTLSFHIMVSGFEEEFLFVEQEMELSWPCPLSDFVPNKRFRDFWKANSPWRSVSVYHAAVTQRSTKPKFLRHATHKSHIPMTLHSPCTRLGLNNTYGRD